MFDPPRVPFLRLTLVQDEESGEDFGDELDKVDDDEDEEPAEEGAGQKRKVCIHSAIFSAITHLRTPLFSVPLLPNRRSLLQGLRGASRHHPRSRLLSPSKRTKKSRYSDPTPFTLTVFCSRSMLFLAFQVHTYYRVAPPLDLSTTGDDIGCSLNCIIYITGIISLKTERGDEYSVQLRYHLYASLHALFPSFSMTSCEKWLANDRGRAMMVRTPWQGMTRSKFHSATVLTSLFIVLEEG